MGPDILVPLGFFAMCAVIAIGFPLVRAHARRMERGIDPKLVPNDLADRLTRMEQAIESVAVEVERISEGQRFTTKLLSERAPESVRANIATGLPANAPPQYPGGGGAR